MPTHAERRLINYTPQCVGARVRSQTQSELLADLTIGFGPFRESFTSRVELDRPNFAHVRYEKGPFRYLNNKWTFTPQPNGCSVDFFVEFEFRSRLLQAAIGAVFDKAVHLMVSAFLKRAREVYGPPATTMAPVSA